jgi:hypothetical protein
MKKAQTGDRVSALAARYAKLQPGNLNGLTADERRQLAADVRSMAASLLRQDETKGKRGLRGLIARIVG